MPDFKIYEIENNKLVTKKEAVESKGSQAPPDEKIKELNIKEAKDPGSYNKSNILIDGESIDQYEYSFAQCCNPVQGDDIFAYLTSGKGLKIHRINCKNATHLLANYSYRVLQAEWAGQSSTNFIVDLSIIGVDSGPGVIQAITSEISNNLGINIRSFSIEGKQGYFEGKVSLFVKNKDQLNVVINSINKLEGVSQVTRIIKN
jgi:GTP pyrophosphokinase